MGFIGKSNSSPATQVQPFSMANVQTKLTVSKAADPAEKEADAVAKRVVDEQKDKKAEAKKDDGKKDEPAPAAQPESMSEPKKEGIQAKEQPKEDKKEAQKKGEEKEEKKAAKKDASEEKDKVSKKDDKKQEAQKKGEEKEEKKAAKKDAGEEKDKVSKKDDKKQEAQKKGEEKEEKKAAKKDAGEEKDKVSKKDDKKQEAQKKGEEKEEKKVAKKDAADDKKDKVAKKEDANKDKKPVDKEKETNVKPQSISRKENSSVAPPVIMQKPQQAAPATALSKSEGADKQEEKNDPESDEAKMQAIEGKINAKKGSGRPLNNQVKADMESSFKYDFSEVKIHTDKEAAELCGALNAHAFAIGNDIFFNSGKYDPESDAGKELLAHELTHVVQQKDTVQRAVVYRTGAGGGGAATGIDEASKTITVNKVKLPKLKQRNRGKVEGNIVRPRNYDRDPGLAQGDVWKTGVEGPVATAINSKVQGVPADPDTGAYYFGKGKIKLFGTKETLIANSQIPLWSKAGNANAYDVDHIREMQLGGGNDTGNMELLNFSANRSSGSVVKNGIRKSVQEFLDAEKVKTPSATLPTVDKALKEYDIKFQGAEFNESVSGNGEDFWSFDEISKGDHLNGFNPLSAKEIEEVKGSPLDPIVYTSEAGGSGLKKSNFEALPGVTVSNFDFSGTGGEVAGRIGGTIDFKSKTIPKKYPLNLNAYKMDGVLHGGYIKRRASGEGSLEKMLSRIEIDGLSPVVIDFCDLVPGVGIVARGRIVPTVKIIEGLEIDFFIEGDKVELSKTFTAGEFKSIPPPFKISDASVTVFAGSNGIGVRGNIDFEINNIGKGKITGSGASSGLFQLAGKFEFDKKIFNKAEVEMTYTHQSGGEDKWEIKGNIQIPQGKIKGVKKADITVGYDGTTLTANGNADFDIPGIEHGKLNVTYTDEQMVIEGEVDLKHKAIKSGKVTAKVEKTGDDYKVALTGNAKPNIPGIDTELTVSYNDGIINITGTVAYNKGRLTGSATVGVTNQAVGADGQPSGGAGKDLTIYGGGSLTLKITDWLQGTAGVTFKPDGNVEVVGKIGIPSAVDIFPKKEIKKDVFKAPTIEIPLFAIPVGSRSIGLVATIGGGAEAYASIGPGQLTEASVEVKYNPAEEENMSVTGNAKFRVPAEAGLRLYVRAGVGLSIGIARLAGGIELGGALGIEGAAEAGVTVNWTPAQGFKLDAEASLSVQPKFKFDVNAYLEAVLDLWVTEFRKEWKHNLASFEWGPAMKFGVKFPVHYEENKPFDISLDDVQFEAPDINVSDFVKGIGQQLLG